MYYACLTFQCIALRERQLIVSGRSSGQRHDEWILEWIKDKVNQW